MDNLYAVTFTTLDGNEQTVEIEARSSAKAEDIFMANYEFDDTAIIETTTLVSNRRDFDRDIEEAEMYEAGRLTAAGVNF